MSWAQASRTLSDQPRLNAWHIHCTSRQLGTPAAQSYDVLRDLLWDACHMAGVHWGTRCKGFFSKEGLHYCFEWSARNPLECDQVQRALGKSTRSCLMTSNNQPWFTSLEISWGFLAQAVLLWLSGGLCHARKCQLEDIVWEEKVWFGFAQWTFVPETIGKRQKGERNSVLRLVPGSHERLAFWNPSVLCRKHEDARMTYYLGAPMIRENRTKNWIPVQPRKVRRN